MHVHIRARADTWVCLKTGMCAVEKSGHVLRHRRGHTDTHVHSKEPGHGTRPVCVHSSHMCTHTFWQMLVGQVQYTFAHDQMHMNKHLLMK